MANRLESEQDDDSESELMRKYAAVVGKKPAIAHESDDQEEEEDEDDELSSKEGKNNRGVEPRKERPGYQKLVYHKVDKSQNDSNEGEDDEMDNISSSQDEARQIGSKLSGEFARGMLSKGSISPMALQMMANSAEHGIDKLSGPTSGALEIRDKLGLDRHPPPESIGGKKEVFNANPMRGRKPLITQDSEEEEDEDEEEDDKAKLLAWKKELEEKFKKFDSFKDSKKEPENRSSQKFEDQEEPGSRIAPIQTSIPNQPDYAYTSGSKNSGTGNGQKSSGIASLGQGKAALDQRDSDLSRPSTSIRIKDEIMANREKEYVGKKTDSIDSKTHFEKNNFFGGLANEERGRQYDRNPEASKYASEKSVNASENDALRQRVSELEIELTKCRRESEATMKQVIENNQKTVQNTRSQYEREIDHLKEQLEEAYIQIKDLEKKTGKATIFGGQQHKSVQTAEDSLEKNFLKLKELYDTVYRANVALVKDQKELQDKYTKLLKVHNKNTKPKEDTAKPAIKIKQESPLRQSKLSSSK